MGTLDPFKGGSSVGRNPVSAASGPHSTSPLPRHPISLRKALEGALRTVSPQDRALLRLVYLRGAGRQELADALGVSRQALGRRLKRAIAKATDPAQLALVRSWRRLTRQERQLAYLHRILGLSLREIARRGMMDAPESGGGRRISEPQLRRRLRRIERKVRRAEAAREAARQAPGEAARKRARGAQAEPPSPARALPEASSPEGGPADVVLDVPLGVRERASDSKG